MAGSKKGAASFGTIVAVFGSVLIALGVAWLIAQNWHQMPSTLKIIILLAATGSAYIAGTVFKTKNYQGIAKALLALGALLYTLSIFLIAQIFFTSTSFQGQAWLWLIAWIGVLAAAYIFVSSISLIIALIEFVVWLVVQYIAFSVSASQFIAPGILAFYLLSTGILLYGLSLWHKTKEQDFASVYQSWTAFYFLYFAYILSFQTLLPMMWPRESSAPASSMVFLFFLSALSVLTLISGIVVSIGKNAVEKKEIFGVIAVVAVLALLIGLTSFVSDEGSNLFSWIFGGRAEVSSGLWALWILVNIVFILLILAVIFYGTWQKLPKLINMGITFFSLDIITRYIGFIMDLWGYTSLSVIFITGGIVLLGGGWLIEKWRRNLITKARYTKAK